MATLKHIHFEISTLCNSQCVTCPHSKINRPEIADIERIKNILTNELIGYKNSIETIEFFNYNEPLLTPDILFELAELTNKNYGKGKGGLVTNGSIMSGEIAKKIIELEFSHVYFSVDGFSPEIYNKHRIGLDRDKIYDNINFYLRMCQYNKARQPFIVYTITEENEHEVYAFKRYWGKRFCSTLFQRCDGRGGNDKKEALEDVYSELPCTYALDGMYILSDLKVVPCCEDWSGLEVIGDLNSQTLKEIWEGEKYNKFRELQTNRKKQEINLCKICKTNMIYGESRYVNEDLNRM